jgi:lipid-A-disaccharide synthase
VTLELALAQVPTVAAYRIPAWEGAVFRMMAQHRHRDPANLVLGENVVPEYLQATAPRALARACPLLADSSERRRQLDAFARLIADHGPIRRTPEHGARAVSTSSRDRATPPYHRRGSC